MALLRTEPCPIKVATFTEMFVSTLFPYTTLFRSTEEPQFPRTSVVTPMRAKFSANGSSSISSAWVWTSINPGATVNPWRSICSLASPVSLPIPAIRPSFTAMSAKKAGLPVPSTIRPLRRIRSKVCARNSPPAIISKRTHQKRRLCFMPRSEVKLVDVLLIKNEWLAQEDVVAGDFELAQRGHFDGFVPGLQFRCRQRVGGVDCQVAQVLSLPENHTVGDTVFDVTAIFARQSQANHFDLAGFAGLLDCFSGAWHRGRANRHDQFQVREIGRAHV